MLRKKKILCYVTVFDQVDIVKKSLDFLVKSADKLELVVVENYSEHTPEIQAYVEKLGQQKLIHRYYQFEQNIASSAFLRIFNEEQGIVQKRPHVIITDGDLTSDDPNWLDEELGILKHNKDVFACGITLELSNLPLKAFPEAKNWIPPDISEQPDYYEAPTGGHLMIMRGREFAAYLRWREENGVRHIDSEMFKYAYEKLGKKWARTKVAKAYHLTWDLYADKSHPYTKFRLKKSFDETWDHEQVAGYKLRTY